MFKRVSEYNARRFALFEYSLPEEQQNPFAFCECVSIIRAIFSDGDELIFAHTCCVGNGNMLFPFIGTACMRGHYSRPQTGWDVSPGERPASLAVMAWLVRAIYRGT